MRIFFSAGEASGDAYAAALIRELRERDPSLTFEGVGGKLLREAGATVHADSTRWGAISITESAAVFFRIVLQSKPAWKKLEGPPGILVPIDFGFFNVRFCRKAKAMGWKILYFVPPGSWRRDRQGGDVPALADEIVTPFSWSAEILQKMGGRVHWFGHPLNQLATEASGTEDRKGIAILPGSRLHEVDSNLPAIAGALKNRPEPVEFAVAPTFGADLMRKKWEALAPGRNDIFTEGDVIGVLRRAKASVVCSGTATLQAVIANTPQVVIYRLSKIMEMEGRLLGFQKRVKLIALPNIFLNRKAIPELIQYDASPEAISDWLRKLETDTPERQEQLEAYKEVQNMLGGDKAISQTADLIVAMARA